jgi:glucose/arabinose dehydrogenase
MSTNPFVPKRRRAIGVLLACAAAIPLAAQAQTPAPPGLSANATVFARGFDNPRGSKFGPDGALYVAEAGRGGTTSSTIGQCPQAAPPGPYTNA